MFFRGEATTPSRGERTHHEESVGAGTSIVFMFCTATALATAHISLHAIVYEQHHAPTVQVHNAAHNDDGCAQGKKTHRTLCVILLTEPDVFSECSFSQPGKPAKHGQTTARRVIRTCSMSGE